MFGNPLGAKLKMNPPKYLYKYQPVNYHTLENLKAQKIFFSSPLNFNDPYDCALIPNITEPTEEEIEEVREYFLSHNVPEELKDQFKKYNKQYFKNILIESATNIIKEAAKDFMDKRGVTCFSEKNDDLLMWSHYADKYKGICLEFSTDYSPFDKIHKVIYDKQIPSIKISDILLRKDNGLIEKLYCLKSIFWEYEQEWRGIHADKNIKYGYPTECLTGVYFGSDISREYLEIICLILNGQNETVKYWEGFRSKSEFKIEFKPFSYISYLEGKKAGLI
jgi:hypothetical protein